MKNVKYSVETQDYDNPIDLKNHSKTRILGVFNSKDEAERFILETESPDRYSEDLEGWIVANPDRTTVHRIKLVPM